MYEKKKTLRGILKKERKKRKRKASQTDRQTEGKQASLVEQWEPAQEKAERGAHSLTFSSAACCFDLVLRRESCDCCLSFDAALP